MDDWRPIETAPTTGHPDVMLWDPEGGRCNLVVGYSALDLDGGTIWLDSRDHDTINATYWQPLPSTKPPRPRKLPPGVVKRRRENARSLKARRTASRAEYTPELIGQMTQTVEDMAARNGWTPERKKAVLDEMMAELA